MRKVRAYRLDNLVLSGADCFVLDMLADNLPHQVMDQVSFLVCIVFLTFCICTYPHILYLSETFLFSAACGDLEEDLPKARP